MHAREVERESFSQPDPAEAAEPIDCRIFEFFTKFLLWIEVLDREGSRSCFVKIVMAFVTICGIFVNCDIWFLCNDYKRLMSI